ncbi:crossover junction endodeoxyribonuclease RuvC [Bathymodiolus platifrons methanotrophic gill symbiont]|uniref:crossover junction endodeoxyribonuclease RuvC n=1 Tax=Bathymodiolus platifrons methanotrophic gill symbiont TaxID=113268 RepID=UPI0011CB73F7|nr:crossover junction endodeoxyribonuclease RuvC [Bathymodiolus platifrons methanotrophic gill symbiont]TXL17006.1 crossover junction endodeoxyribonuclease RuvC [Methylococcaceae bacterium HT3]TXL21836.1 crossover junction endodeoxyribonuclease RuvC [Methylococcaceae bacterium HT2]GFO74296.1 crossover junction endodeoxyribonuclease RuvC [Bathymodiolus platifrons methanotrophic gill symbiont]
MTRILGIDPGSRLTGFGVIDETATGYQYIASGCLRIKGDNFPLRLKQIFAGISDIVEQYQPAEMVIEQVFMHKNADSALKLGQARGAAICAVQLFDIPVYEYAARQVKQAVVGKGSADKLQVQHMVKILLGITGELQIDASDALGISICHANFQQTQRRLKTGMPS